MPPRVPKDITVGYVEIHVSFLFELKRPILRMATFNLNDYPEPAATYTALCERVNMLPFLCIDVFLT